MFANKWNPSIEPFEQITYAVQVFSKGTLMNVLEKFCFYQKTYTNIQLNGKSTFIFDTTFETTLRHKNGS